MDKPIQFPNYDEIVRRNKEIYLDSIIDRYGEENRELLSQRFDAAEMCFFVTPEKLNKYLLECIKYNLAYESLRFLEEIGIDISNYKIIDSSIVAYTPESKKILTHFFGLHEMLSLRHLDTPIGIFSYLEENSDKKDIEFCRKDFLNIFDNENFRKESERLKEKYSKYAELAKIHLEKSLGDFRNILDYIHYLEKFETEVCKEGLKSFFLSCEKYLCEEDKLTLKNCIDSNSDLNPNDLKNRDLFLINFYFNPDKPKLKVSEIFKPGLIEYFGTEIIEELFDKKTLPYRIREIKSNQLEYLEGRGLDVAHIKAKYNLDEINLLSIPEVTQYLPSDEMVKDVIKAREETKKLIFSNNFKKRILNSYEIGDANFVGAENKFETPGSNLCNVSDGQINEIKTTILLSPLDQNFDLFDCVYDHEKTHYLEINIALLPNGNILVKCGIQIIEMSTSGEIIYTKYKNLNEAITQMMAVNSTLKRYSQGVYIFEKPKHIDKLGVSISCYDKNIPKAKALVDFLPSDFIKKRIDPSIDFIYEYFDEETWNELDSMIDDDKVSTEDFISYMQNKRRKNL